MFITSQGEPGWLLVVAGCAAGLGVTWFVFSAFWASFRYKPFVSIADGEVHEDSGARRRRKRSRSSDGWNASARPTGTRTHDDDRDTEEIRP